MSDKASNIVYLEKRKPARDVNLRLGRNIRRMRLKRELETDEFAEILGITPDHLRQIEAAKRSVYASELYQFSEALGVPVTDFHLDQVSEADNELTDTMNRIFDVSALKDECISLIHTANDADTLLYIRDQLTVCLKD